MQTRYKSGVFRTKLLVASLHQEPATVPLALANPQWKNAMEVEYQALLRNNTWKFLLMMLLMLYKVNGCFE